MKLSIKIPEKLHFLFKKHRFKVAYGGRCSGKSWSFARALLVLGLQHPLRILCTREIQNSIKDSVKKLLQDQIQLMGLGAYYNVQDQIIRGSNGTEIIFSGLGNQTAESIKSFEGIDIVWIEEGQNISKKSLDILIPTIRKPGSEIWLTFNPGLESAEVYQRFVVSPPTDCISVLINYLDNPWFTSEMDQTRCDFLKSDPENFPNIYLGVPLSATQEAIYSKEVTEAISDGRVCHLPADPSKPVHLIFDIGFSDATSIIFAQKISPTALGVVDHIEDTKRTIDQYALELRERRYNYGSVVLPHDAFNRTIAAKSVASQMEDLGFSVMPKHEMAILNVEQGIQTVRQIFPKVYFDISKTQNLLEALKRYRRNISRDGVLGSPKHDHYSNSSDSFRYMCVNAHLLDNFPMTFPMMAPNQILDNFTGY